MRKKLLELFKHHPNQALELADTLDITLKEIPDLQRVRAILMKNPNLSGEGLFKKYFDYIGDPINTSKLLALVGGKKLISNYKAVYYAGLEQAANPKGWDLLEKMGQGVSKKVLLEKGVTLRMVFLSYAVYLTVLGSKGSVIQPDTTSETQAHFEVSRYRSQNPLPSTATASNGESSRPTPNLTGDFYKDTVIFKKLFQEYDKYLEKMAIHMKHWLDEVRPHMNKYHKERKR